MVKMSCSNCGFENEYKESEIEEVFPYSRERLICKKCNHALSVNSYFTEGNLKQRKFIFWIILIIFMLGIAYLIFWAGFH